MKYVTFYIIIIFCLGCETSQVRLMKETIASIEVEGKRMDCRAHLEKKLARSNFSDTELQDFEILADYFCDEMFPRTDLRNDSEECEEQE